MSTKRKTVRLSIDCLPEERQIIKILCLFTDQTITDYVMTCVRKEIKKEKENIPTILIIKALKDSSQGKGVKSYDNIDEMFEDLGI